MRGSRGRRIALILWAAFAFVTWNVVFDRQVYLAAVQFTQQQIDRHQRGEPAGSIASEFRPRLGDAARFASLCGASVLIAGVALTWLADRRPGQS
jgi:hypothetical protein